MNNFSNCTNFSTVAVHVFLWEKAIITSSLSANFKSKPIWQISKFDQSVIAWLHRNFATFKNKRQFYQFQNWPLIIKCPIWNCEFEIANLKLSIWWLLLDSNQIVSIIYFIFSLKELSKYILTTQSGTELTTNVHLKFSKKNNFEQSAEFLKIFTPFWFFKNIFIKLFVQGHGFRAKNLGLKVILWNFTSVQIPKKRVRKWYFENSKGFVGIYFWHPKWDNISVNPVARYSIR